MEYPSLDKPTAGAIRFNTDSSQLEIYDGNQWTGILATSPEQQTGGTRAIFSGNYSPMEDTQNYVNVETTGNAIDFGDYVGTDRSAASACGSRTRGLVCGGYPGSPATAGVNEIDCNIFATTGSCFDFGNLTEAVRYAVGGGSETRGLRAGGYDGSRSEVIDYVTISSTGNAKDFGDISVSKFVFINGACNQTRTLFPAGATPGYTNQIEYVTTATTGNAADFGDQTVARGYCQGLTCNATRGLFFSGSSPSSTNIIDYVTIPTLGNAIDFGDMSYTTNGVATACSPTRGVVAGGGPGPGRTNIEYVHIMTTGNSVDFGDLSYTAQYGTGISNGHGGL